MPKTCADFAKEGDGGCCMSCHEDADAGYSDVLMEVETPAGTMFARVCCRRLDAAYAAAELVSPDQKEEGK